MSSFISDFPFSGSDLTRQAMSSPAADLAATAASSPSTSVAASPTTDDKRPSDAIADSVASKATVDSFPVFEDFPPETTTTTPTSPSPPPFLPSHRRRRSRRVTEHDLRAFKGLPNRKVFDYVDLVKSLRTPPSPGKLPIAPASQLGTEREYIPHQQVRATSPPPWAR